VIGHRLASLRGTDRILVIDKGRLIEQGAPAELMRAGSRYSELFASQLGAEKLSA
jgi:ABC-type multidrug transport system fused ATPase/permease subunit